MAAHDGVSCGRGPIARLIDHARWCSATTAAAAAAGMLHSRGRQQHLGYSKYWGNFARQMHWQDVVADLRLKSLSLLALKCELATQAAYLRRIATVLGLRARHHARVPDDAARFANRFEVSLVEFGFLAWLSGQFGNAGIALIYSST